jgi:hypothetical protein
MWKERFLRVMLIVASVLLFLNLLSHHVLSTRSTVAVAVDSFQKIPTVNPQSVGFRGNGIGLACSEDGQYVYAAGSGAIFRSTDFGKAGTWELVLTD